MYSLELGVFMYKYSIKNKTKQNKTKKQNKNKTKQNKTKQKKTNKQTNKQKQNKTKLFRPFCSSDWSHLFRAQSFCFVSLGFVMWLFGCFVTIFLGMDNHQALLAFLSFPPYIVSLLF